MTEPIDPAHAGEWTADDLKGADVHPQASDDDEPEDGAE
jgi:hypothetical protein